MNAATVVLGLVAVLALLAIAVTLVAGSTARRARGNPDTLGRAGLSFPPHLDGGPDTHTVTTDDGANLAVANFGPPRGHVPGPTFVLAHGWAADRTVWAPVTRRLVEAGYRVVVYDQRSHGTSTTGTGPLTIDRLGRDLTAVIHALELTDVVVGAHSGGGYAALSAVVDLAGPAARVSGLVLAATAAHDDVTSAAEARLMGSRLVSWVTRRPRLGLVFLGQTLGPKPGFAALDATRALFATTPARVRGAAFASSRGLDLRAGSGAVTMPTVVVHGDSDRIIAPERGRALANVLPDARFELVGGVGHMVPLEAPRRLADVLVEVADRRVVSP